MQRISISSLVQLLLAAAVGVNGHSWVSFVQQDIYEDIDAN